MSEMPTYPAPEVKGGMTPYLQVDGALKAAEFYAGAFGAEQVYMVPPDDQGRTMHVHLYVDGTSLMLGDAYPDYGHPLERPGAFNLTLHLRDDTIDEWWKRAVDAGCSIEQPLQTMFWGDRWGLLKDPFGISWAMNAPVKAG